MNLKDIYSSLVKGDNKALQYIYLQYGDYCKVTMQSQRGCSREESEDLFIESVMILREKILEGKISQLTNARYYLYKTCENNFLARLKSDKSRVQKYDEIEQFYYGNNLFEDSDEWDESLKKAVKQAWEALTERCRDVLYYFYVDSFRMTEIMELMQLSTTDVAKTTKSRCYKRFVILARKYYNDIQMRSGEPVLVRV